ncbi:MAG: hypothetical protein FWD33_01100 [Alphaproteobacteria bacterium]|nr:hypothetical protein [Alphaproteobacteria bacterium]
MSSQIENNTLILADPSDMISGTYIVPRDVTHFAYDAFKGFGTNLEFALDASQSNLRDMSLALNYTGVTSITLPSSTQISIKDISDCRKLEHIHHISANASYEQTFNTKYINGSLLIVIEQTKVADTENMTAYSVHDMNDKYGRIIKEGSMAYLLIEDSKYGRYERKNHDKASDTMIAELKYLRILDSERTMENFIENGTWSFEVVYNICRAASGDYEATARFFKELDYNDVSIYDLNLKGLFCMTNLIRSPFYDILAKFYGDYAKDSGNLAHLDCKKCEDKYKQLDTKQMKICPIIKHAAEWNFR